MHARGPVRLRVRVSLASGACVWPGRSRDRGILGLMCPLPRLIWLRLFVATALAGPAGRAKGNSPLPLLRATREMPAQAAGARTARAAFRRSPWPPAHCRAPFDAPSEAPGQLGTSPLGRARPRAGGPAPIGATFSRPGLIPQSLSGIHTPTWESRRLTHAPICSGRCSLPTRRREAIQPATPSLTAADRALRRCGRVAPVQ